MKNMGWLMAIESITLSRIMYVKEYSIQRRVEIRLPFSTPSSHGVSCNKPEVMYGTVTIYYVGDTFTRMRNRGTAANNNGPRFTGCS